GDFPVSNRQLAMYLGVSQSMMHMSERDGSRSLTTEQSAKLTELMMAYRSAQKTGKAQKALFDTSTRYEKDIKLMINRLKTDAVFFSQKARMLQKKLDEMSGKHNEGLHWLSTVETMLENYSGSKREGSYKWLDLQQALVTKRLLDTGIVARAKLKMEIALAKARAAESRLLSRELK
ncbi:MAG TPA: hypothetical protein VK489_09675, partial [Ferruginibacter sp.]|nr:hypothetical protein [Ferruginibacter sp.]